jgi:integrase/recombinase XerD
MKLHDYLQEHHTTATINSYSRNITIYLQEQPRAEQATYKDIVEYIGQLRNRYTNAKTVKAKLNSIKKYYDYLIATEKRKDHPCKNLNLKDKLHQDVQLQDLLTQKELENILGYQSKRMKNLLVTRDKALLSLLVYQALTKTELKKLILSDLNLEAGTIYIKSTANSNSRTLTLKNTQILLFHKYIHKIRPQLLSRNPLPASNSKLPSLFITTKGKAEQGDSLKYMFERIKKEQGKHVTINIIRQSVLALQLKQGNDIRKVQLFAGHKNASSTERYKAADLEELKAGINKYHPLQ